ADGQHAGCLRPLLPEALPVCGARVSRPIQEPGDRSGALLAELRPLPRAQSGRSEPGAGRLAVPLVELPRLCPGCERSLAGVQSLVRTMVTGPDPATGALAGVCARIGSAGRSDPGRRLGDWGAGVSSPAAPTGVTSCSARCRPPVRLGEADHFATTSWHKGISENCPHGPRTLFQGATKTIKS